MTKINKDNMLFSGRPRSRLVNTTWKEISGVDHPANEEEGWLVMKAKQLDDPDGETDEWAEELAEELYETDFSDCPAEIQTAAQTLMSWLAQEGYDGISMENSEKPGQFLSTGLTQTDFDNAPPTVKQAAASLGAYLATEDEEDDENTPDVFPPIGVQLYGGTQKGESNGLYSLRSGNGSQGFAGALSSDRYGKSTPRRARGMNLTKSYSMGKGKKMPPSFKKLAKAIYKAAGPRFYGDDFGDLPFTTGNNNSYFSSQSPSQFRGGDTGGVNYNPQGGSGDSFYRNWTNPGPYIGTGDDGVSDGALANGLDNVAALSKKAAKEATDAAFYQFLEGSWPQFAKKAADIIANYSSRVTSPTWTSSGGDAQPPADVIKSANDEIHEAVEELKDNVYKSLDLWLEVTKRNFSEAERRSLARQGKALPGGSFPIPNKASLMDARHAVGRAKNKPAARAIVRRRAHQLGVKLPASWNK